MRILVVEDELKMATLLRRELVEQGYAADIARTGRDARRLSLSSARASRSGSTGFNR